MKKPLNYAVISKELPPGRYFDTTTGLHLYAKVGGRKYWIYRYTYLKKTSEKCLGSFPDMSLSEAREIATQHRLSIKRGELPARRNSAIEERTKSTFKEVATDFIETHRPKWKNAKHADQWTNTMRDYVYPVIGNLPVDQVTLDHVLRILRPIWSSKTETASRVRGRIDSVLGAATVMGLRSGINPAQWRGHLEHVLPAPKQLKKVKHHPALPYKEIYSFITELHQKECISALALEFLILTGVRTSEVLGATWAEITEDIWIIPASRMKAKIEHRVPLTQRCLEILLIVKSVYGESEFIFHKNHKRMSTAAMSSLLGRIAPQYTVHGFRSTFRDWVAEETEHAGDVAEMALAHKVSNSVEASYRRGNLIARRRRLMEDWRKYCTNPPKGKVINFQRKAA